jgi:hydrogenase/urease accessory protein HupE
MKPGLFACSFAVSVQAVMLLLAGVVLPATTRAHDPGLSSAQAQLRAEAFTIVTGFAPADAQELLPKSVRTLEPWSDAEFETVRDQLLTVAPQLWEVRVGDTPLRPRESRVQLLPGDNVSFELVFPPVDLRHKLTLRAPKVPELPPGHRQFVIVMDGRGSTVTKKLLSASDFTIEVPIPMEGAAEGPASTAPVAMMDDAPTAWEFVKLGVEHIWTGYDHLLFLFALLVVCRRFRSIVAIITCFTVAHSLTLALATLDAVNLPARLVEPAIAASIVFVGLENLWRRGEEPPGRWALTFVFGLVHGFGFATVLRELGVGRGGDGVAMPLFTFNVGVELGQIAIAAVVLPLVWRLRRNERFVRVGVPALSAIVAAAGLYWLLERTVFS